MPINRAQISQNIKSKQNRKRYQIKRSDMRFECIEYLNKYYKQPMKGHSDCVNSVSFSPNGKHIVS